jgi:hypothetical protein
MNLRRIGGVASVANGFLWVLSLVFFIVVLPRLGLVGPSDLIDPAKGIAAWAESPGVFSTLNIVNLLEGIASLLMMLALRERMKGDAPILTTVVLIGVSIFSALWSTGGLLQWEAQPSIVSTNDVSAYRAVITTFLGLCTLAAHGFGWALLLTGWAAAQTRKLPRTLAVLGMLAGAAFLFEFIVPQLGLVGTLLVAVWSLWVGIVLLQAKNSTP